MLTKLGADGYPNFPANRMSIRMHNGCISDGNILGFAPNHIEMWLHDNGVHPNDDYNIFIRRAECHFVGFSNGPYAIFQHDPARHTPRIAQINIGNGEYYLADSFQVYNISQHHHHNGSKDNPSDFPPDNHIYVAVPGDKVYSAPLQRQPYTSGIDRQSYLFPGIFQMYDGQS